MNLEQNTMTNYQVTVSRRTRKLKQQHLSLTETNKLRSLCIAKKIVYELKCLVLVVHVEQNLISNRSTLPIVQLELVVCEFSKSSLSDELFSLPLTVRTFPSALRRSLELISLPLLLTLILASSYAATHFCSNFSAKRSEQRKHYFRLANDVLSMKILNSLAFLMTQHMRQRFI